jgi:hypothetical protein
MNFYWKDKKDQVSHRCTPYLNLMLTKLSQLYARRGTVPASVDDVVDPWTTFQMTLREPGPIPPAFDFTRFLVSSITFMTHLSEVSVYFDDKRLVRLSKECGVSKEVPMLRGLKVTSPEGMMTVKSIETKREFCCSSRRTYLYSFSGSSSHRRGSGPMGVHRWLRKAIRWGRYPKGNDKSSQWILLVTLLWVRSVHDSAKDSNASASGAQGIDQPFGGKFVGRCPDHLRCKCRRTGQQENDSRTATFYQEESSRPTAIRVDIRELHCRET